ncbi:cytochrome P450 [Hypomontagnella monticulosa]|nr:cytochrome P450 [Hypomontagnella monticulosa]
MAPTLYEPSPASFALLGAAILVFSIVGNIIYTLFLHPLRSYPGPILWRISSIPRVYHEYNGNLTFRIAELHKKYGSVVRITPRELAYNHPQAWKDIYGHRTGGAPEFPKWDEWYRTVSTFPTSVIDAEREEHSILRRQLSHGFSDKSMREQDPIIRGYVDLLIQRLHENSKNGSVALNMREWYNWTTFDVIGDLGFGSSFGCLQNSSYHPWVRLITQSLKETSRFHALIHLGFKPLVDQLFKWGIMKKNKEQFALVRNKLQERMKLGVERPDLIEGLLRKKDEWQMGLEKLTFNSNILIVAGSETTATLLCGATYLLTTHPEHLARLTKEVRSAFKSEDEINLTSVGNLQFMLACLNEAFRRYPPVSNELPRSSPKGGGTVLGKHVPEGAVVSVWQWPLNHDSRFWKDPMTFAPERWMGDPAYKDDCLEAMQPFSFGPRNCIGRNLAYAEMRLILAKIVYNFDMTIADECRNWIYGQKSYTLWDKPDLNVYLTPVPREKSE